jgi:hypothetical protein
MRRLPHALGAALLVACTPAPKPPAEPPAPPPPPPAPAPINLADVAGKWTVRNMPETGDSVLVTYEMTATASDSGWTVTLPKRKPMKLHVMVSGDSVMTKLDQFESVLRKGVKVSTEGVFHLRDGKLVGTQVAHYTTTKADSVLRMRTEGTKAP